MLSDQKQGSMDTLLVSDADFQLFKTFSFNDGQSIHINNKTEVTFNSSDHWKHLIRDGISLGISVSIVTYFSYVYWFFKPNFKQ